MKRINLMTNSGLVQKLQDILKMPEEQRNQAIRGVEEEKFLAPVVTDPSQKTEMLRMIEDVQHNLFLPVFTDWEELGALNGSLHNKAVCLPFKEYKEILAQNPRLCGIVINPFGMNLVLREKPQIKKMDTEKVKVGDVQKLPQRLINAMTGYFEACGDVEIAYLLWMVRENGQGNYLLVVGSETEPDKLFPQISKTVEPYLQENIPLDMIHLREEFGKRAVKGKEPFYRKNPV